MQLNLSLQVVGGLEDLGRVVEDLGAVTLSQGAAAQING